MQKCQFCNNTEKYGTWRIVPYSYKLDAIHIEYCENHDKEASNEMQKVINEMGENYSHTFFYYADYSKV